MDLETEKVIDLLFPEGIPGEVMFTNLNKVKNQIKRTTNYKQKIVSESWKENPELYQYLSKIGSFDVDQLSE